MQCKHEIIKIIMIGKINHNNKLVVAKEITKNSALINLDNIANLYYYYFMRKKGIIKTKKLYNKSTGKKIFSGISWMLILLGLGISSTAVSYNALVPSLPDLEQGRQFMIENDYNLNISRYVSTAIEDKIVDLEQVKKALDSNEANIINTKSKVNDFLKELGLPELK